MTAFLSYQKKALFSRLFWQAAKRKKMQLSSACSAGSSRVIHNMMWSLSITDHNFRAQMGGFRHFCVKSCRKKFEKNLLNVAAVYAEHLPGDEGGRVREQKRAGLRVSALGRGLLHHRAGARRRRRLHLTNFFQTFSDRISHKNDGIRPSAHENCGQLSTATTSYCG